MTFGGRFLFIFSTSCNVLPVPVTILEFYHISFLTWDTLVLRFFRELYFTIKLIKVGSKTRSVRIIAYFLSYKLLYKWLRYHSIFSAAEKYLSFFIAKLSLAKFILIFLVTIVFSPTILFEETAIYPSLS